MGCTGGVCLCVSGEEGDEAGPPPAPPAGSRRCVRELIHRQRGRCLPHPPRPHPRLQRPPRSPAGPRHGGGRGGLRGGGRRREGAEDGFARTPRAGRRPLAPRRPASPSPGGCSPAGRGGGRVPERSGERGDGARGMRRGAGGRDASGPQVHRQVEVGRWMVQPGMVFVLFNKKPTSITKPQMPSLSRKHRRQHLHRCARTVTRRAERRHACVTSQWCSAVRVVLHHRRGSAAPKA